MNNINYVRKYLSLFNSNEADAMTMIDCIIHKSRKACAVMKGDSEYRIQHSSKRIGLQKIPRMTLS